MQRAGELRQRFRFETDTGTTDTTAGTHTETATAVCTRSVAFLPAGDPRFAALRARYPGAQFALALRYDATAATIAAGQLATWITPARAFDVLGAVDPTGRRRELHVALAERNVPQVIAA